MRLLIQRVSQASVTVKKKTVGKIGKGYLLLVGFHHADTEKSLDYFVQKTLNLRLFTDENDKMNLSLQDIGGDLLVVSQFTLYADASKGRRPSFTEAAPPAQALTLYNKFVESLENSFGKKVQTGEFGADMSVDLTNDGPVTILLES
ncbi:MAG: D-aminoacyl-tRNA deacylase [Candidatus Algichlamydia australiensis]|nr:D-aminoacyl-tRNA deacylase [Chlamydiales bacterium]